MENVRKRTVFTPELLEELKKLVESGVSNKEISKMLGIGTTTISTKIKEFGIIRPNKNDKEIQKVLELHSIGYTVQEIHEEVGSSLTTIRKYIANSGSETNTKHMKFGDIDTVEKIKKLVLNGKTNSEIASILGISKTTARKYTELSGLETNSLKVKPINKNKIEFTSEQLEVLYGSLLGDMCLTDGWKNVRAIISQGGNQEKYFDYKCDIFKGLIGKPCKDPRYDKRTDKWYNKYVVKLLANPIYTKLKKELYPNNKKTITKEWLNKVTPRGLAFWFMDDGSNNGVIATNSFSYDELLIIQDWFKNTYNIIVTIQKAAIGSNEEQQYVIYILSKSRMHFEELIFPYMIPEMYYKLKKLDPNSVNCGKTLRDLNTNL